jgi:GTP cyclohydrolase IA
MAVDNHNGFRVDKQKIQQAVRMILEAIGEDPRRPGLVDTPRRVADYFEEVTVGLHRDPGQHLETTFDEEHQEMVIVKDIPFESICEHHLVPFVGKAHVVYIPKGGKVAGLSKLARIVEDFSRRPQLQERFTAQVADLLVERLHASGAMVVVEAEHMCMTMRGVRKPGSHTVTSAVRGIFETSASTRAEAMSLIMAAGR